jgi:hypothetical protein
MMTEKMMANWLVANLVGMSGIAKAGMSVCRTEHL